MESINLRKRKQLKSRKYRNKLRKPNSDLKIKDISEKDNNNSETSCKPCDSVCNNIITANRLTLKVFPRAVTSDTITRSLLGEINNEKCHTNIGSNLHEVICNETVLVDEDSMLFDVSPKPNSLFTPVVHTRIEVSDYEKQWTSSTDVFNYEDLMSEILLCAEEKLQNYIHADITKEIKKNLKEIQENHEGPSVLSPMAIRPIESITGIPKSRTSLVERNDYYQASSGTRSCGTSPSPLTENRYSPKDQFIFCTVNNMNDTPEYKYYPHKLK